MKRVWLLQFLLAYPAYSQHIDFKDIDFSQIDSIAITYKRDGLLDPIKTAQDLTQGLKTDLDKYRVIFRWICENIDYDVKLYMRIEARSHLKNQSPGMQKRWTSRKTRLYTRHTLRDRMTICEGYAWLLETMCTAVGVSCVSVVGYARNERNTIGVNTRANHAWNAIRIENKWYLSDPTWASSTVDLARKKYYRQFDETYFLTDPADFIVNHYPTDPQWMLLMDKPTLAQFVNAPIRTTAFIDNRISKYRPMKGMITVPRDSSFHFDFVLNRELKAFQIETSRVKNRSLITELVSDFPVRNAEGYYVASVSFSERGYYSVEIFINRKLTMIYKVFVK